MVHQPSDRGATQRAPAGAKHQERRRQQAQAQSVAPLHSGDDVGHRIAPSVRARVRVVARGEENADADVAVAAAAFRGYVARLVSGRPQRTPVLEEPQVGLLPGDDQAGDLAAVDIAATPQMSDLRGFEDVCDRLPGADRMGLKGEAQCEGDKGQRDHKAVTC